MVCVPRQRQALSRSRRKSAKRHWGEDIHYLLLSQLGVGHDTECDRGCEHFVPFAAVCQRLWGSWRTTSAAVAHIHTACWQRGVQAHDTTAAGRKHGKKLRLLPECYSIFTRLLRHLYDFPPTICHTLPRQGR